MPVVSFERIEAKLIFPGYNELGTDLAEIHNAISTGLCSYVLGHEKFRQNNPLQMASYC